MRWRTDWSGLWLGLALLLLMCAGCTKSRHLPERNGGGLEELAAREADAASEPTSAVPARPPAGASPAKAGTPPAPADVALPDFSLAAHELELQFSFGQWGDIPVVVRVPARQRQSQRYPLLIAFHGRGETLKGPKRGARGWLDDYALGRAISRLEQPPLTRADFEGMVDGSRLKQINEQLAEQASRPLIVVMPYLPDMLRREEAFTNAVELAALIVGEILPRVRAATPALHDAQSTGIDGVSLGGRAALLVGFLEPHAFAAVGALQAAVDESEIDRFAKLAVDAQRSNGALQLRLLTSSSDYYLDVNRTLHSKIVSLGGKSELLVVSGTHGYAFNRGPGAIEMLLFHDRALRRAD